MTYVRKYVLFLYNSCTKLKWGSNTQGLGSLQRMALAHQGFNRILKKTIEEKRNFSLHTGDLLKSARLCGTAQGSGQYFVQMPGGVTGGGQGMH